MEVAGALAVMLGLAANRYYHGGSQQIRWWWWWDNLGPSPYIYGAT